MAKDFAAKKPDVVAESRIPSWVWIFTLTVTASFIMLLVYLSNVESSGTLDLGKAANAIKQDVTSRVLESPVTDANPEKKGTADSNEATALADQVEQAQKALSFYKLLTEQEVKVDEPEPVAIDPNQPVQGWILQAASFRKSADADGLRAQLILAGLPDTYLEPVTMDDQSIFYRVMVGPFDNRSKMNQAKDILAESSLSPIAKRVTLENQVSQQ